MHAYQLLQACVAADLRLQAPGESTLPGPPANKLAAMLFGDAPAPSCEGGEGSQGPKTKAQLQAEGLVRSQLDQSMRSALLSVWGRPNPSCEGGEGAQGHKTKAQLQAQGLVRLVLYHSMHSQRAARRPQAVPTIPCKGRTGSHGPKTRL